MDKTIEVTQTNLSSIKVLAEMRVLESQIKDLESKRDELLNRFRVMDAYDVGMAISIKSKTDPNDVWEVAESEPCWKWDEYDYRVAQPTDADYSKYVPTEETSSVEETSEEPTVEDIKNFIGGIGLLGVLGALADLYSKENE